MRVKYPRTRHLPSSRSRTDDDKIATVEEVARAFKESNGDPRRVIITEKMDGEATTIYPDGHSHARSIDSKFHPSRSIIRELAGLISHEIPQDFRICGENIFAVHSIEYSALDSYFQVYNIWNGSTCISWDSTVEWAQLLELTTVPVLYDGPWVDENHAHSIWTDFKKNLPGEQASEGFVVRIADEFELDDFGNNVFKFVREKHVTTGDHWMHSEMKTNSIK